MPSRAMSLLSSDGRKRILKPKDIHYGVGKGKDETCDDQGGV